MSEPKIKIHHHKDGRREIVRLLSIDGLSEQSLDNPMTFEKSIMWLEDIDDLRYVRVATITRATSRRGPLHIEGRRVLGYSKLTVDAPTNDDGFYVRRVFYLKDKDQRQANARVPRRAIDPKSILPGVEGSTLSGSGEFEMANSGS